MEKEKFTNLEKKTEEIKKIYFLIHPGFSMDSRSWEMYSPKDREAGIRKYKALPESYLEKAKGMDRDELMFAFAHQDRNGMKSGAKEEQAYMEILGEIKKIIGRRLIVLSNQLDVTSDTRAFEAAKRIANSRGFNFNRDVFTEAFGEYLVCCVSKGADTLNRSGRLNHKTKINTNLTEARVDNYGPETIGDLRNRFKRVKYR
jgi:hypothetical protein